MPRKNKDAFHNTFEVHERLYGATLIFHPHSKSRVIVELSRKELEALKNDINAVLAGPRKEVP